MKQAAFLIARVLVDRPSFVREERKLKRLALMNRRASFRELVNLFNVSAGKTISRVTAAKVLRKYGLRRRVATKRPLLTPRMRRDRYKWAQQHSKWSERKWKTVLFSDEKVFKTDNDRHVVLVTRTVGEKYLPDCIVRTVKHGPSVHVWGVISFRGMGPLRRVRGTLTGADYRSYIVHDVDVFGPQLVGGYGRPVFQQDKAPAHWARQTLEHFERLNVPVLDWPGNSPDMNPIEHVWSEVAKAVRGITVRNSDELFDAVSQAWENVSLEYVRTLYRGMPRRVQALKSARGGSTRY